MQRPGRRRPSNATAKTTSEEGRSVGGTRHSEPGVPDENRALVVDDDRLVRMNTRLVLEREGWLVDEAGSVAEALLLLEAHGYEVVISDIMLPDGDGLDLLRHLRDACPDTAVVLMTGSSNGLSAEAAVNAGAAALLEKPFPLGALMDEVRASSASRRPRRRPPRSEPQT
jgi:two-component system response regulator PilR (NtrC family)